MATSNLSRALKIALPKNVGNLEGEEAVSLLSAVLDEKEARLVIDWAEAYHKAKTSKGSSLAEARVAEAGLFKEVRKILPKLKAGVTSLLSGKTPAPEALGTAAREAIEKAVESAQPPSASVAAPSPTSPGVTAAPAATPAPPEAQVIGRQINRVKGDKAPTIPQFMKMLSHFGTTDSAKEKVAMATAQRVIAEGKKLGIDLSIEDLIPQKAPAPAGEAPLGEPLKTATAKEIMSKDLPKDRQGLAALVKELRKASPRGTQERTAAKLAATVGRAAGPENLKFKNIEELATNVPKGRLGAPSKSKVGEFLKNFLGVSSGDQMSKRFRAEEALGKAGVGGFAGVKGALKNVAREGKSLGVLLPLALLAPTAISFLRNKSAATDIENRLLVPGTGKTLQTAGMLHQRMELEKAISSRRVAMERSPELAKDVFRILSGQDVDKGLTGSEIQIGNVQKGRSPLETERLMNILMGRLDTKDNSPNLFAESQGE